MISLATHSVREGMERGGGGGRIGESVGHTSHMDIM